MKEKPDLVIVYGDTNSTFAGSFAAVQLHLRVAHVESGYRSHDKSMPEEVNRILTDHISDLLFVPTMSALQNLRKESVQGKTYLTGDVMCDVLLDHLQMADEKSGILKKLGVSPKEYLLLTFHRVKNTDNIDVLRRLVGALLILKDFPIVFPIHPRTEKMLKKAGLLAKLEESKNILIIPPLNYLDFVKLEKNANKIITDSGGVQKEAYILGVPCVTLRDATEIGETVAEGWNFLAADDPAVIVDAVRNFHSQNQSKRRALGDGKAANRIMKILLEDLEVNKHCSS
jgi:UDP-N-acetylglucosamine 2-epimerase (non-hydrolysing)